jgi:hypothetical protein
LSIPSIKTKFSDAESEPITLTFSVTPAIAEIFYNATNDTIYVANTNNSHVGIYSVSVTATDGHLDTTIGNLSFNITITANGGCQVNNTFADVSYAAHTNITALDIYYASGIFKDPEGDTFTRTGYTVTPAAPFMSFDAGFRNMTISDPWNAFVGNYSVSILCRDNHTDTATAAMTFTVEIRENLACKVLNPLPNLSYFAHHNTTFGTTNQSVFHDLESNPIHRSSVTFSPTNASAFLTFDGAFTTFTLSNPTNAYVGNYTVYVWCDDNYSDTPSVAASFIVEIKQNQAPQINETISNKIAHGNRTTTYTLSNFLFNDLESNTISHTYSVAPPSAVISYNVATRVITVTADNVSAGNYTFTLTAKDPYTDTGETNST